MLRFHGNVSRSRNEEGDTSFGAKAILTVITGVAFQTKDERQ